MSETEKLIERSDLTERKFRALVLAYLLYDQNMSHKQAQGKMHPEFYKSMHASRVTEDLKLAEEEQWCASRFRHEIFSEDLLSEIRLHAHPIYTDLEDHLRDASGGTFRNLKVFYAGPEPEPGDQRSWDKRLKDFGERVATTLRDQLASSRSVGVGWGQTLGLCIRGMEVRANALQGGGRKQDKTLVFPTAGEPLGAVPPDYSSSNLSIKLSAMLNRSGGEILSLNDVPPIIPVEFKGRDREVILKFIRHLRNYDQIFFGDAPGGTGAALIDECDTLITSVGNFHQWTEFDTKLLNVVGVNEEDLKRLCKGDMGGAMVEKGPLSDADRKRFDEIQASWTGATLQHYRRLAEQSGEKNTPGVLVCATGSSKASVLYDLITDKRVINQLFVCDSLAEALDKKADNKEAERA